MARIAASSVSRTLASQSDAGVKLVCGPQRGAARAGTATASVRAAADPAAFKNGQRFRAGIEGRIFGAGPGGLRAHEAPVSAEGRERFELWVGAAVLANKPS